MVDNGTSTGAPWCRLPAGSIDIPGAGSVLRGQRLHIEGWAATERGPCSRIRLTLDGQPIGDARLGRWRPDVAEATGLRTTAFSGFELTVALDQTPWLGQSAELSGLGVDICGGTVQLPAVQIKRGPPPEGISSCAPLGDAPPRAAGRASARADRPLRLLICCHDLRVGGAQLVVSELSAQIRQHDEIQGTVLSFGEGPQREAFERLGFEVHVFPADGLDSYARYTSRIEALSSWIAERDFDVALVNTVLAFPAADACSGIGLSTLWAIHESYPLPLVWETYGGGWDPRVTERAQRALSSAGVLAFPCSSTRVLYERYLPSTRCVTLPYGIGVDELQGWLAGFDREQGRRHQRIPREAEVVLCVGTIEPRKGQVPLVQAFAAIAADHPQAVLRLVGGDDGPRTQVVRAAAAAYGVEDRLAVIPIVDDVRPHYAVADLLVSASDVESLPRSMLEAMALGLPVLGTDIFGVSELISDGLTGWLCRPHDVRALAEKLDEILALDPGQRQTVAGNAHGLVEAEYRSDMRSRAWSRLLREVAVNGRINPFPKTAAQGRGREA